VNSSNENTFSYIFQENQQIWVVVRGTVVRSIENWINNVDFVLTPLWSTDTKVEVHKGFKDDSESLYQGILSNVQQHRASCPSCSVFITGHSLGGAIASIISLQLKKDVPGLTVNEYTYGSPRTGNTNFAQLHIQDIGDSWRVVNANDIVPHLPTKWLNIFQHVPTEVWYQTSGSANYKVCNGSGEDPRCSDSVITVSITAHLTYFGIDLRAGTSHGCN
jgi:predicted lipase